MNMKRNIYYIAWLVLSFVPLACDDREPELFDKGSNGAYFDYNGPGDFEKSINFADYILGDPDTVPVTLNVKLLGYLMDDARTLAVKTKDVEGYEPAKVKIEKVVFANREYEKQIEVKVKRPAKDNEGKVYAVCIYLDGSGDIGTGIAGKNEVKLFVTESYIMPDIWGAVEAYQGVWSKEKHKFLVKVTEDNGFYLKLVDSYGVSDNPENIALNAKAVNALLANKADENPKFEFPIIKESDDPAYTEPYFWAEYEDILGFFRSNKFCRFVGMLGGATTNNVASLFASNDAKTKMEEEAENFHRDDFYYMLNEYYKYALSGYPISEYKNLCWMKMSDKNYRVRIPYWWEDPDGLGTADIVKGYFGSYSDEKYKFMLQTMLAEDGADNFITESILPFVYDKENGTYAWDSSPFGKNQLSGEERLLECYRIIKAANEKRPPSKRFKDIK